jgi:hypothetical protein
MNVEAMEARIEALENQVKEQQIQLRTLQDIEEIKRLQRAYGFYLEHWMSQEVIDCFADGPDVVLEIWLGTFLGKEGVRRFFTTYLGQEKKVSPEFMHMVMQLSGIVDVSPDGQTAKGRWYAWGALALPMGGGVTQAWMAGVYGAEYVKQDGKWKIKILRFSRKFSVPPGQGWVKQERVDAIDFKPGQMRQPIIPDLPRPFEPGYPSGYIFPFHFKHPVTGKESSEKARNTSLNIEGLKID